MYTSQTALLLEGFPFIYHPSRNNSKATDSSQILPSSLAKSSTCLFQIPMVFATPHLAFDYTLSYTFIEDRKWTWFIILFSTDFGLARSQYSINGC